MQINRNGAFLVRKSDTRGQTSYAISFRLAKLDLTLSFIDMNF